MLKRPVVVLKPRNVLLTTAAPNAKLIATMEKKSARTVVTRSLAVVRVPKTANALKGNVGASIRAI